MPRFADSAAPTATGERIAKLLARAGVASRREVERMVADGRVALNGTPIDSPATTLASLAGVTVDGAPVAEALPARLFVYHKPTGLLVTERDPRGRPTIYDRLPPDLPRVVPVGRLDLNTEGLLLLTTDGGLKRQLELPSSGVARTYRARAYGPVSQPQLESLMDGVEVDGVRYGPIDANLERRTGANSWIEMTLTEGKNREVRRVLEHLGLQVGRLIRVRYGPFVLGDLPPGAVGEVRGADLVAFRQQLDGKRRTGPERVEVSAPRPARPPAPASDRPTSVSLPGEGRAPGAKTATASRPARQAGPPRKSAIRPEPRDERTPKLDPRAGGATGAARHTQSRPAGKAASAIRPKPASASQPDPGLRRGGGKADGSPTGTTGDAQPPRPARIQRKAGWARPKPKPGARPKKR